MAYSSPWDETLPDGATTLASDLDLVIQNLKRDLRERLDALVLDWTTDPVVRRPPPNRVRAARLANQAINDTTTTVVAFDSIIEDPLSTWSSVGKLFTLPHTGLWLVVAHGVFAASATNTRDFFIMTATGSVVRGSATIRPGLVFSTSVVALFNPGDTHGDDVQFVVQQNSGGPLNFTATIAMTEI